MADLGRLVMRSGAAGLAWRIPAALVLVFAGKLAGVWAPVMIGEAIDSLRPTLAHGGAVSVTFIGLALGFGVLRLLAAAAPNARDAIFTSVSQATMAITSSTAVGPRLNTTLRIRKSVEREPRSMIRARLPVCLL